MSAGTVFWALHNCKVFFCSFHLLHFVHKSNIDQLSEFPEYVTIPQQFMRNVVLLQQYETFLDPRSSRCARLQLHQRENASNTEQDVVQVYYINFQLISSMLYISHMAKIIFHVHLLAKTYLVRKHLYFRCNSIRTVENTIIVFEIVTLRDIVRR